LDARAVDPAVGVEVGGASDAKVHGLVENEAIQVSLAPAFATNLAAVRPYLT